ncbi:hypothetical protein [Rhodococcus sovatensis]|uniref:Uncharacterized protein n=1 Tax=Rhodococcus sovatensis TaxID=1805840 RepID=A0ABZ2PNU2_9NOCA
MTTVPTLTNPDMTARIARVTALARTPGHVSGTAPDAVDIEAWGHVGDPLAEDLISDMRERKLMGGDLFLSARSQETSGLPAAVAFFADVESVPEWADFDLMKSGARMGNRNPLGMLLGFHGGLAFTYIDPATATVMGSTGRSPTRVWCSVVATGKPREDSSGLSTSTGCVQAVQAGSIGYEFA